ncbi:YbcC family protein [Marinobacter sp.]|uniref:YbcC family protein n=1 Tax=Marinobacter sp. TaxID=50741 RepID=UPI003A8F6FEC
MMESNAAVSATVMDETDWQTAITRACGLIAPIWPLDQWIAVNPFWGLRDQPVKRAEQLLEQRAGFSFLMPVAFYREAWEGGRISDSDLQASLEESQEESGTASGVQPLFDLLKRGETAREPLGFSILDVFPENAEGVKAADAVCDEIGRLCGAFFDARQARWSSDSSRHGQKGFFEFWLEAAQQDLSLDYRTGIAGARKRIKALPVSRTEAVERAVGLINLNADDLEMLCHNLLMRLLGWASWSSGMDWRAGLAGDDSDARESLLSVLLVWESVAIECAAADQVAARAEAWKKIRQTVKVNAFDGGSVVDAANDPEEKLLWIWQRAYEIGYQRKLVQILGENSRKDVDRDAGAELKEAGADVQAVFCIDVRSEVMRRHLENDNPKIQTLGFAGFFGLPVSHQSHGPFSEVQRLPGLLAPAYRLIDTEGSFESDNALNRELDQREITRESVRNAKYSSLSTFTLVETTGLAWAWKLFKDSLHQKKHRKPEKPGSLAGTLVHHLGGDPLATPEKVKLVAGFLQGMSLTGNFAPILMFVGHGTQTDNNPNHAGMACGACGGQSGGVNARLAAALFNEVEVREGLAAEGIHIPDSTWAVAAEHCTVTDEITIFDQESVPASHQVLLAELQASFLNAGREARKERATPLKLNGLDDKELLAAMHKRAVDWSEVRPEWGLANNAAIIFAKRDLTRGKNLAGRVFLHDYDPELDTGGQVLEALMSAPMMVANWINLQYFASVTVPEVYGAGNKLLHSVVGGNLGVIEGNGTDLRIGLPLQSVHDGIYWRHEPLRLTVLIDAPRERIEAIVERQPDIARLVNNQWLWLHRTLPGGGQERFDKGVWHCCSG